MADDTGVVWGLYICRTKKDHLKLPQQNMAPSLDNYSDMLALDSPAILYCESRSRIILRFLLDFTAKMDDAMDKRRPLQETRAGKLYKR